MRIELTELLKSQDIVHPTRILSMAIKNGTLQVLVQGYPWWKSHGTSADEEELELCFEGLSEGSLDLTLASGSEDDYEALETFAVRSLANVDWAQPSSHSIYCSAPLQDPLRLYTVVQDHLLDVDSFKKPSDFLNFDFDGRLNGFMAIASSSLFLVARAPQSLSQIICEELTRQGVPHNVLTKTLPLEQRLWVTLGSFNFLCQSAMAIFEQ
jgi:hypothetical protein